MDELTQLEKVKEEIAYSMIEASPQELRELEEELAQVELQIAETKGELL